MHVFYERYYKKYIWAYLEMSIYVLDRGIVL